MKKLRKLIFWCHLIAGVSAGLVILVMSVTGVLLTFERQIIDFAEREMRIVQRPTPDVARLGPDALLAKATEAKPSAKPSGLTVKSDPNAAATIALGREGVLYVNPYTGEVLGEGAIRTRAFFRGVTDWHRWLGTGQDNRAVGRAVTGASNTAFLVLAISGVYLWWPKKWSWKKVRPLIFFQRGLKPRARNFNWHNTAGFWSSALLIVITATGMVLSYQWANNLLYRLTGTQPPAAQAPAGRVPATAANEGARSGGDKKVTDGANLNQLWDRAEQQAAGWEAITLRLPLQPNAPVVFSIREGKAWLEAASSQLTLSSASGEALKWEPYAAANRGRKARTWARFLHTGEAGGIVGQALAGLASLGGALLVWSGLALVLKRFRVWASRRKGALGQAASDSLGVDSLPRRTEEYRLN